MEIIPAIDIKGGQCVRLFKGDYNTVEKVADSFAETALGFERDGAKWLHMVDLDGAKTGLPVNSDIFLETASITNLKIELGGGIRDLNIAENYIEKGIKRIILGTAAIKNPEFVKEGIKRFGTDRIAVGIDTRGGFVSTEGWLETGKTKFTDLAEYMCEIGVRHFIFTDIDRDGTLSGVNLLQTVAFCNTVEKYQAEVFISGGIHSLDDIRNLKEVNVHGAICGKSLYSGAFRLKDAIAAAR
jgi:phosphoribosylformimino-5-aminoimidazole carboxamide ribotide isomerase